MAESDASGHNAWKRHSGTSARAIPQPGVDRFLEAARELVSGWDLKNVDLAGQTELGVRARAVRLVAEDAAKSASKQAQAPGDDYVPYIDKVAEFDTKKMQEYIAYITGEAVHSLNTEHAASRGGR